MKTYVVKKEDLNDSWVLIDAKDQVLGRLASKIAFILRGKNKASFSPDAVVGDGVIVINADKIAVTGQKRTNKTYYHHTGYPGGIRSITYDKVIEKKPDFPLKKAVKGMLPKNRLGRKLLSRLKIYTGENHPHLAQKPEKIEI
jgi:large subunit ribosomal protein L13